MRIASLTLAALLSGAASSAQAPSSAPVPAPASLIDELIANAAQYRATLPAITADESIISEASFMGMFPDRTRAQGTLRVLRGEDNERLRESRQVTSVNGKPVAPDAKVNLPFTLFGGFGSFQEMFFTPAHRVCFDFTLQPPGKDGALTITIASLPTANWPPECPTPFQMVTGLVRIDPATHQIVHFERTTSPDPKVRGNLAPFASVDLAPAKVGDATYWLPTLVIGRSSVGKIHIQFTAHYSNYHRYTASITLLPGATEVDPSTPAPSPPPQ